MAAARPTGLGDVEPASYVLARFEEPLPKTRKELVARIENILGRGGVQKLVVELGRPIQISQMVDANQAPPPKEALPPDDLWARAYNNDLVHLDHEMKVRDPQPYVQIFQVFTELAVRKMKPKMFYCLDHKRVREWLGHGPLFKLDTLYGIDLVQTSEMPDDGLLLVGTSYDELDDSVVGLLIRMDLPKGKTA
jgi:hypothetical protein